MEANKKNGYQRDNHGRFATDREPNVRKFTVRVSPSLEQKVKTVAGKDVAAWLREAITEKLARETQNDCA